MSYQALYRKWRPMVFDDVIGQHHITSTIKNEILNNKMSHAYLFTGTRGTGKTSTAKIFSRAVNCLNPENGNPCNECEICKGILSERILDVIEIDAASNTGVENIRDIIDQTKYAAAESKYRVYIIDEVHMLSQGAFNALLKTLEEPTAGVIFILATTEIHKVPATIMSRCQRFDFKTINSEEIAERIRHILSQEKILAEDDAVEYISRLGEGSMRDSLSILDQCLAFKNDNLTFEDVAETVGAVDVTYLYDIASFIAEENANGAVSLFEKCIADGKNTDYFAQGLMDIYRNMLLYKISQDSDYAGMKLENTKRVSDMYTVEKLMNCVETITKLLNDIKFAASARVHIEMALVKLSTPCLDDSKSAILARISAIENSIRTGAALPVSSKPVLDENLQYLNEPGNEETADDISEETCITFEDESDHKSTDSLSLVCSRWDEVENSIMNSGKITLYMSVRGAKPYATEEGISLVFEDAEKRDSCSKPENKESLLETIKNLFGIDLQINYLTNTQFAEKANTDSNDVFGKIKHFSKDFLQNIEI